jgi:hypothetical protein
MRRVGAGVVVVAGACVLGGCGLLSPQSISETTTLDQPVTSVKLDGRSGDMTVRGQSGLTKVTVQRTSIRAPRRPGPRAGSTAESWC